MVDGGADVSQTQFAPARLIALTLILSTSAAMAHGSHAGVPGDPNRSARTVEVMATESDGKMSFSPDSVEVAHGEQVRFVIVNKGALPHEFTLGDKAENAAHAKMMAAMPDMKHNDPNAVTIEPGKTATILWRFSKPGLFEFACLIPGHYESGMHGAVTVK